MSRFYTYANFFSHYLRARRWNSFHSPYLFKLFAFCCDDHNSFAAFGEIEKKREELIHSKNIIRRSDFGAGASESNSAELPISLIAKNSLSLPFQCRFLFRLMKLTVPEVVVEFGTSLGISTSYLAKGSPESQVITVEGDPAITAISTGVFKDLEISNIRSFNVKFDEFIAMDLKEMKSIDFVFLDGNHQADHLLTYYHSLKPYFTINSIVMVDDIYWSRDMNDGWIALTGMPEVTQSVDCFQFGLLFFNPDFLQKENHIIRLPIQAFKAHY